MKDEFLTFSEFAKLVKIGRSTLYRRVANTVSLQQLVRQSETGQKVINRSAMRFFTVADAVSPCPTLRQGETEGETGQKEINRSTMRFFTVADAVSPCPTLRQGETGGETTCNNDPQQKIIDFLMAEIEDLKKDKENLTLANADLRKLLDQQQQLNLHNQELLALEQQKSPQIKRIRGGWKH